LISNALKDRVKLQSKTITQAALGQTVTWKPVDDFPARVVPLKPEARIAYQQLKSNVTHKVEFRKGVTISLGNYRMLWKDKTLEPVEPPQTIGAMTIVLVREI